MKWVKKYLDFYIKASLHVAVATTSLAFLSQKLFLEKIEVYSLAAVFSLTVLGYNLIKYFSLFFNKNVAKPQLQFIKVLTLLSLLSSIYSTLNLNLYQISTLFLIGCFSLIYTLPVFTDHKNGRSKSILKIILISVCWSLQTVYFPLLQFPFLISSHVHTLAITILVLTVVWMFVFEIMDLKVDPQNLHTIAKQIGIIPTKVLGEIMLVLLAFYLYSTAILLFKYCAIGIILTSLFLLFASKKRNHYYSVFYTESIPLLWLVSNYIFFHSNLF